MEKTVMMSERSTLTLPAKEITLYGGYDVLVCGGGPAGCAAAIGKKPRHLPQLLK